MAFWNVLVIVGLAYLLGSMPTALWVGRRLRGIDIREHGSGNAGATNAYRVLGVWPAMLVLMVDMGKGWLAVVWISQISLHPHPPNVAWPVLAGLAAIAGHVWSVFAGFRGGKGVGTAAGMFLGLMPLATLGSLLMFIIVVTKTRIVSAASLTAALLLPVLYLLQCVARGQTLQWPLLAVAVLVAVLIVITHRANIGRLIRGEEARVSSGKRDN